MARSIVTIFCASGTVYGAINPFPQDAALFQHVLKMN